MKARDYPRSIERYRAARAAAQEATQAGNPMGRMLLVQNWIAEGAAWVAAGNMPQGAHAFEQAGQAAQQIPHALFAIEGYRSAAQAWFACGKRDKAMDAAKLAIQEAHQMPAADRPASTVPLLLGDLLRMEDPDRCKRIARCAAVYQNQVLRAQADIDRATDRLGPHPPSQTIALIEQQLLQVYEQAFQLLQTRRERLIGLGSPTFQTVVALGRQWLHPAWAGLPDVRHPLDLEPQQWNHAPGFAVLPDPQPLLDAA
jgi:tetratricopeptide (TPR) repeat protein